MRDRQRGFDEAIANGFLLPFHDHLVEQAPTVCARTSLLAPCDMPGDAGHCHADLDDLVTLADPSEVIASLHQAEEAVAADELVGPAQEDPATGVVAFDQRLLDPADLAEPPGLE